LVAELASEQAAALAVPLTIVEAAELASGHAGAEVETIRIPMQRGSRAAMRQW
jgi:hypothetical protein